MENVPSRRNRYTTVAMALHWIIALLIIGQLVGGEIMHRLALSDLKYNLFQYHKSIGLTIFALSFARLGWRLTHKVPPLPAGMKPWEVTISKLTHWAFYGLMIGIPLMGWAAVSANPLSAIIPTKLFYLIPIPNLPVPVGEAMADLFAELHEYMTKAIFVLLLLHIGAALKHHYKDKDDVLTRMLPWMK